MVEVFLLTLLVGAGSGAVWFVLAPLRPKQALALTQAPIGVATRHANEEALSSLEELDLDFQMGKLDEGDYKTFRASFTTSTEDSATEDLTDKRVRRERIESLIEEEVARRRGRISEHPLRVVGEVESPEGTPEPAPRAAANRRALLAAGVAAALFLTGTGILVADQLGRQTGQRPVATLEPRGYASLTFLAGDANRLLLGSSGGLSVSSDGGRSWIATSLSGNIGTVAASVSAATPGRVLAAGGGLLATSSDGGATWAALPHDLPGTDVRALALDPRNPDRVYAIVDGHGLFESADAGRRWIRLSDRVPPGIASLALVSGDPPAIYAASAGGGVQVFADGGRGWAGANGFLSGALPTLQANAIAYDPNSGDSYVSPDGRTFRGALYAGTDQGLFKSIDGGGSWNRLPLRVPLVALAMSADGRTLAAIDDGGRLFRSRDRGLSWGADQ